MPGQVGCLGRNDDGEGAERERARESERVEGDGFRHRPERGEGKTRRSRSWWGTTTTEQQNRILLLLRFVLCHAFIPVRRIAADNKNKIESQKASPNPQQWLTDTHSTESWNSSSAPRMIPGFETPRQFSTSVAIYHACRPPEEQKQTRRMSHFFCLFLSFIRMAGLGSELRTTVVVTCATSLPLYFFWAYQ